MVYFDSDYLKQYLDVDAELKVYVNHQWYTITDLTDIESPEYGIGIDVQGIPATFRYKQIEKVDADGFVMDIDQLQDKAAGIDDTEADAANVPPEGGEGGGPPMNGGKPPAGEEEPPPPEEEEPPQEVYRRVVSNMITESKKKDADLPFKEGEFVENIDLRNEFCGSRGAVKDVTKSKDDSVSVEYRTFNYGFNFKPGQTITVDAKSLKRIDKTNEKSTD